MDFSILYAIQNMHGFLDPFFVKLADWTGSFGEIWLIIGAVLITNKDARKCGYTMLAAYVFVLLFGELGLKNLIARARPCQIDQAITMLVERPTSYSCPSTHTAWAFAAAMSVFLHHKKAGIAVLAAAALIGFSRLYLFLHFPSDVLFGAVLGVLAAIAAKKLTVFVEKKIPAKYME